MKKILVFLCFWLAFTQLQGQQTLSLRECVGLLTSNNLTYRDSRLQVESAVAQLGQVQSQRLPQMGLGAGQNLNFGRSIDRFTNNYIDEVFTTNFVGINAQVPLFQGLQLQHQMQQSRLLRDAALSNQEAILNQQTIRLLQNYVLVLATNALYEAAQEQVASSKKQVERVEKQVAAGTVGNNILFEIKAQLANDAFDEVTARNNYLQARLTVFQLINLPPNDATVFAALANEPIATTFSADAIYDEAVGRFPEIKSAELRQKSFDSQIKSIKAANLPSLNASANFGAFYASSNPEPSYLKQLDGTRNGGIALNLFVPILGRWQTRPRVAIAKAQQQLTANQLDLTKQQLRQNIDQNNLLLLSTADRYRAAQSQTESLEANFGVAESRLNAGTASVFEYTLAKANLARAQANLIRARYEYTLQQRIMDFYQKGSWDF
ncbi:MAG: TolC family protein [Cytophagia bacterium]|nr:MAG: TolC family protein [Runella sp.]TAG17082.1 MAG: TolC family protein [Cytophagales bacterium]TAG36236.1 MAG: TolC family protein [Cytophagia bacterium]TAG52643.1 MAG: TolC family protein [Runella slithyformis]TAG65828.1 MAG: TolC family protein [Runella slithyformis]